MKLAGAAVALGMAHVFIAAEILRFSGGNYIYRAVPRDDERYFGVQLRKDF